MKSIKYGSIILVTLFMLSIITVSASARKVSTEETTISSPVIDEAALKEGSDKVSVIIGFDDNIGESDIQVLRGQGADIKRILRQINAVSVRIPPQAVSAIEKNPRVRYVTKNDKVKLIPEDVATENIATEDVATENIATEDVATENVATENIATGDIQPLVQILPWGIDKIDAEKVHPIYKGAGINVAIIDTGVNDTHEDLIGRVVQQWDYVNNDPDAEDDHGHGTHVAGTVAANNNTVGVIGVAPLARLFALKVLNSAGSGTFDDVAQAIIDAADAGADIESMSLGCSGSPACDDPTMRAAVQYANDSGVLIIASAGNDYGDPIGWPAKYPEVLAITATDINDIIAPFSSVGPEAWVSAPGVDVRSTVPKGTCYLCDPTGYRNLSGTSMSAPHASGTAVLIASAYPGITNTDMKRRLGYYSKDLGPAGRDPQYGWGRVNASNATFSPAPPGSWPPPPPPPYYTITEPAYGWIDGVTGGTEGPFGDDSATSLIPIGFNFNFYEATYTGLWFSTNGLVTFSGASTDFSNDPIPSAYSPDNFAAPYWDDLYVEGSSGPGHTYYKLDTSTFPRRLIITWHNVRRLGGSARTTFEVVLYEDGRILYQYQQPSLFEVDSESIGVEDIDAVRGQQFKYNEPVSDYSAVLFTPPGWTPPVPPVNIRWSAAASTGAVDEADTGIFTFNGPYAYLKSSAPLPANLDIRYNVFIPDTFGGNKPGIKVRYRDNGGSSRVRVYLKEYNVTSGSTVTRMTFDSNSYAQSSSYQTRTKSYCNPGWTFDFNNKIYYVETSLNKTASTGSPGLAAIQLTASVC